MKPPLIVCMGISGVGKSTCARRLAANVDLPFIEADDLHPLHNKEMMRMGVALSDTDREPWMQAVCDLLDSHAQEDLGCVLAHSALRRVHRESLRQRGMRTLFLHLGGSREVIAQRLRERKDHFMSMALLDSQIDALQTTNSEADVIDIDANWDIQALMTGLTDIAREFIDKGACNAHPSIC